VFVGVFVPVTAVFVRVLVGVLFGVRLLKQTVTSFNVGVAVLLVVLRRALYFR
jgi:hypothetical protein